MAPVAWNILCNSWTKWVSWFWSSDVKQWLPLQFSSYSPPPWNTPQQHVLYFDLLSNDSLVFHLQWRNCNSLHIIHWLTSSNKGMAFYEQGFNEFLYTCKCIFSMMYNQCCPYMRMDQVMTLFKIVSDIMTRAVLLIVHNLIFKFHLQIWLMLWLLGIARISAPCNSRFSTSHAAIVMKSLKPILNCSAPSSFFSEVVFAVNHQLSISFLKY